MYVSECSVYVSWTHSVRSVCITYELVTVHCVTMTAGVYVRVCVCVCGLIDVEQSHTLSRKLPGG